LGKYSLGIGVLALGHAKIANLDVRSAARPLMEELAEYSQISVSIGMRHELSMIYVDTVRSSAPISLQRGIGARLPIGTTSIGRAYICGASDEERNEIFEGLQAKNKEDWVKIRDGIREALEDYAKYGFCISIGDWMSDIWAVGVPYKSPDGKLLSFNCGGPAFMLKEERLRNDIGPRLLEMVNKIKTIYK
jgi:DNA-binding IclR family transcriptional regulator